MLDNSETKDKTAKKLASKNLNISIEYMNY